MCTCIHRIIILLRCHTIEILDLVLSYRALHELKLKIAVLVGYWEHLILSIDPFRHKSTMATQPYTLPTYQRMITSVKLDYQ